MEIMNIFKNDAFSLASMSDAIERVPTNPARLGQLNLFSAKPIRTTLFGVEEREGSLSLIQTSLRGESLEKATKGKRKMRYFETSRLAKQDTILASELAFVRSFNTEDQVQQVQAEIAQRLNGNDGLLADLDYTREYHRLGAIQGKVMDADGTSVIYDFYDEFDIVESDEIAFDLSAASPTDGDLRKLIQVKIIRPMRKIAKGSRYSGIRALCSPEFYDAFIAHPEIRETYKNWSANADLRKGYDGEVFQFGGVSWEEYVGDDSNSEVALGAEKVRFVPEGTGNTIFQTIYSPGETFDDIGQLGKEVYSWVIPEEKRNTKVDLEVFTYPLYMCRRPDMLFRGKAGAA